MKITLLLCIVGCYRCPFILCAANDARLLTRTETSRSPPHKLPQANLILDGVRNGETAASPEEQWGALNRVSRASGSFDESGDAVDGAVRAVLTGPRRHRFVHFGRKRALSASYFGFRRSVTAESNQAPKPDTDGFEQHHERAESTDAENGARGPTTKRSSNRFMHFGTRSQQSATKGDGAMRASHNNILQFGIGKLTKEEDVEDVLERMYATVDRAVSNRAGNRIMHFGKREPEYGVSSGLVGEPEFELVTADKKVLNRILHFGKRPSGSSIEIEAEDEVEEKDKRGPLEHRKMHIRKRENDNLSETMATNIDEAPATTPKRTASCRSKYSGRTDPIQTVTGIGRQLQRQFQEWKKRNPILHFGEREPQQLQARYYLAKPLGNRIMHFANRGGYTFYTSNQGSTSVANDKRLKRSIVHFGKRGDDLVSSTGRNKRNQIFHIGKRASGELDMTTGDLPVNKRAGNKILQFGKLLEGADVAAPLPTWPYGAHTNLSLQNDVSKRAHRILHFSKREGGATYDDKGMATDTLVMGGDDEYVRASKVAGLGEPETQSVIRKKRSTSTRGPNFDNCERCSGKHVDKKERRYKQGNVIFRIG
ncbi:hypothetical protein V5799_033707 [Amblyomma americanum]|uniref:Secreted protein n=1 Tax=Amblyomma americanum TaxID=6943 RepID=A0AAQ4DMJ4_AMBAM